MQNSSWTKHFGSFEFLSKLLTHLSALEGVLAVELLQTLYSELTFVYITVVSIIKMDSKSASMSPSLRHV